MAIPKITFNVSTDSLNASIDAIQKTPGLVITGVSIADKITLGEVNLVYSLTAAEALGITEQENAFAYKHISAFYDEAGQGAPLYFMLVSDATLVSTMLDKKENYAKKLIEASKGAIKVISGLRKATGTETITNGVDADLNTAVINAQALTEFFFPLYKYFKVILSANSWNGVFADLKDYSDSEYPNVNVLIANDDGEPEASIGLCLGRQTKIPSQRKQSRVKDGAIIDIQAYFTDGSKVESFEDTWDAFDDRKYTFFRNFANRSGYFFSGDKTLVTSTNDFSSLARGFVMNEAMLITYEVLIDELSDEIEVTSNGNIHPVIIKSWQGSIETQIKSLMQDTGKISGVKAYINEAQNVIQTNKVAVSLKILPVGYSDFIDVDNSYTVNLDE